jgi:hypothetical protein
MRYIGFEREEEAEAWARHRLELDAPPNFFRAMSAVDENDEFVCVIIFTNFSMINVDTNIVIDSSKVRPKESVKMFNEAFGFLFDKLRVRRTTGLSKASNKKAHRIIEHFGYKLEGVMRNALPGDEDLLVYGFLAEEFHNHKWYNHGA